jgi:hypothetical protein
MGFSERTNSIKKHPVTPETVTKKPTGIIPVGFI